MYLLISSSQYLVRYAHQFVLYSIYDVYRFEDIPWCSTSPAPRRSHFACHHRTPRLPTPPPQQGAADSPPVPPAGTTRIDASGPLPVPPIPCRRFPLFPHGHPRCRNWCYCCCSRPPLSSTASSLLFSSSPSPPLPPPCVSSWGEESGAEGTELPESPYDGGGLRCPKSQTPPPASSLAAARDPYHHRRPGSFPHHLRHRHRRPDSLFLRRRPRSASPLSQTRAGCDRVRGIRPRCHPLRVAPRASGRQF